MKLNMMFTDGLIPFGMATIPVFDADSEQSALTLENNTIFNDFEAIQ